MQCHGPALKVAAVDDAAEHVGGVESAPVVADVVDEEDVGVEERFEGFLEAILEGGAGEGGASLFDTARRSPKRPSSC